MRLSASIKLQITLLQTITIKLTNKYFTAIFCVSSVDILITYYDIFKAKK